MNLRDELLAIRDDNGGRLTPDSVVTAAMDESHPLHNRFEWDDSVAGAAYRRQQAHELIRSVRVSYATPTGGNRDLRAFQAIRDPGVTSGYVYEPSEEVALDPVRRAIVLRDMERDWRQLRERYERFQEFWRLVRGEADAAA